MEKVIVAIAREFGSGGREIGLKVASALGIPFYDKEILKMAAENGGLHVDFVASNEEKAPQLFASSFGRALIDNFYQPSFSDTIFIEQSKVIKSIAGEGSCVIVGRCSDYILKDDPACIKVYISASMEFRIWHKRLVAPEKKQYTDADMEKYIRNLEKNRAKYYEHYTGAKKGLAENYDLCIRTDKIGTDAAAAMIVDCVKSRWDGFEK